MAAADPAKPADKSAKKSSSSKVSQFGILISATLCSNCPLKSYFVTTKAQQFLSAQLNFHSIDSLISGLTVASFLLPSYGCCRPCQASKQVCKETQQLEGEQISPCQGWCTYFHVTFDTNFLFASNFLKKIMINIICCFVSGLTVATRFPSSLLPNCARACCEPASRQVC